MVRTSSTARASRAGYRPELLESARALVRLVLCILQLSGCGLGSAALGVLGAPLVELGSAACEVPLEGAPQLVGQTSGHGATRRLRRARRASRIAAHEHALGRLALDGDVVPVQQEVAARASRAERGRGLTGRARP